MMDVGEIFWSIPNFFLGVSQAFTDSINALFSLLPNPDPFPGMIDGMQSGDSQVTQMVVWWLDEAYDLLWIQDMLVGWVTMMTIALGIMIAYKVLKFIRG